MDCGFNWIPRLCTVTEHTEIVVIVKIALDYYYCIDKLLLLFGLMIVLRYLLRVCLQYDDHLTQLERNISLVQERALEQAETDSLGTWLGGEEDIHDTDHQQVTNLSLHHLSTNISQSLFQTKKEKVAIFVSIFLYPKVIEFCSKNIIHS